MRGDTVGDLTRSEPSLGAEARGYAAQAWSPNTRRAYRVAWGGFTAWCAAEDKVTVPATDACVADYIASLARAGRRVATIRVALAAIAQAHRLAGRPSPTTTAAVQLVLKGIRHEVGVRPRQKAPLVVNELRLVVENLPDTVAGRRDRALLLLAFSGAFRRSEVIALDVGDLRFVDAGIEVTLRRSKTDQAGAGQTKVISFGTRLASCPVRAVKRWLDDAAVTDGAVFRAVDRHGRIGKERLRPRAVARVVKRSIEAAGIDPSNYAAHSLRSGMITTALKHGVSMSRVMMQSGHASVGVLVGYDRRVHLWDAPASAHLGL